MTQALDSSSALAAPLPSSAPPVAEVVGDDDVRFARGPRSYRVRGVARCLSAESLKVTLRLSSGERLHLDTLDLSLRQLHPSGTNRLESGDCGHPCAESGRRRTAAHWWWRCVIR